MATDPNATPGTIANPTPTVQPGMTPGTQQTAVNMPTWLDQLNNQVGNQVSGALSFYNNPQANWYQGPQVAGFSNLQTQAQNQAGQGFNQQPYQLGAVNALGNQGSSLQGMAGSNANAAGALGQYQTQFNPNQLSKFMDPYTNSAVNAMYQQSNRNLQENILPGVNSTFTGAGQFGSTRNADFENRAIRDTQLGNSQTAAGMYNTQFNNAMNQNYQWNQNPLQAAGAWGNLAAGYGNQASGYGNQATGYGQAGSIGQQNFWNQNQAQQQTGATQQGLQQKGLDTAYQTWQQQYQSPLQAIAALQPSINGLNAGYRPNTTTVQSGSQPTTSTSQWGGALASLLPTMFPSTPSAPA